MNTKTMLLCVVLAGPSVSRELQAQTPQQLAQQAIADAVRKVHDARVNSSRAVMRGVDPAKPVIVTMSHGNIHVIGTAGDSVSWELFGTRHDSLIAIDGGTWNRGLTYDNALRIDVTPPAEANLGRLDLRVTVPHSQKLVHLRLTGGDISVNAFDGDLEVESDSGMVRGEQLGGGIVVETRDGGIDLGVTNTLPRHAVSLIARNGTITLAVPANGLTPFDFAVPCSDSPGFYANAPSRPQDEPKALEALGMASRHSSGCDATSEPIETGATVWRAGQVFWTGSWKDGGAAVSLRTLRGSIVIRRH